MTNLLQEAINCDDGDRAARIIQDTLGIETDDVVNHCFPKEWPAYCEQRAYIGDWLIPSLTRHGAAALRLAASARMVERLG